MKKGEKCFAGAQLAAQTIWGVKNPQSHQRLKKLEKKHAKISNRKHVRLYFATRGEFSLEISQILDLEILYCKNISPGT